MAADYILFSLLQSGRSKEIARLTWDQVDFELNQINYKDTKNSLDYIFPISRMSLEILRRRQKNGGESAFVFHYKDSKTGHIPADAKAHFKNISVQSGKLISHHDLRRTWGTAALHLDINERIINYCLKHKIHDVNAHYFMRNASKIHKALAEIFNCGVEELINESSSRPDDQAAQIKFMLSQLGNKDRDVILETIQNLYLHLKQSGV